MMEEQLVEKKSKSKKSQIDWTSIGLSLGMTTAQGIIFGLTTAGIGRVMSSSAPKSSTNSNFGAEVVPFKKVGSA